jgi:hypothetical protein
MRVCVYVGIRFRARCNVVVELADGLLGNGH